MNPRPGKLIARWSAALALAVLLACAVVFRDEFLEQWYLWKLDSQDEASRLLAAEKLGELQSVRAVPGVVPKPVDC